MFKFYQQLDSNDCGLACIRMIARYFDIRIGYSKLRKHCELNRLGTSISDICTALERLNLSPHPLKFSNESLEDVPLPIICYWDQGHFVILYEIDKKGKYCIADPSKGKYTVSKEEFINKCSDGSGHCIGILVGTGKNYRPGKIDDDTNSLGRFFRYLLSKLLTYKKSFINILILSTVAMVFDIVVPLLFQRSIDEGIGTKNIGLLWMLVLSQLALSIGSITTTSVVRYIMTKLSININIVLLGTYIRGVLSKSIRFFEIHSSASLIQKTNDQDRIKNFLLSFPDTIFFFCLNLLVFSVMLIYYSPLIFGIFIFFSGLAIGWNLIFVNKRRIIDNGLYVESTKNQNALYEMVNGIWKVKINNAHDSKYNDWHRTQTKINALTLKSTFINTLLTSGDTLILRLKDMAILGITATWVINDTLTFGAMMTISYIVGRLAQPVSSLTHTVQSVQDAQLSYERLEDIFEQEDFGEISPSLANNDISLKNVWFKYPGSASPFVLKDISLEIRRGMSVAIVGESGCGKSTLLKLLMGLHLPQKGELTLSGIESKDLDSNAWLSRCGVVMQNGYIFSDSILKNIAMGDELPDMGRINDAIRIAGLEEFVKSLPMGLNTRLGTMGAEVSGGQKQRIQIARAVYKNPEILFLDEATSSLDANNEAAIVERINDFSKSITLIVAAHRLSTVRHADLIVFLKDGQIAEMGTHESLIEQQGEYYQLVQNQLELTEA